jgi:hypothetical protein
MHLDYWKYYLYIHWLFWEIVASLLLKIPFIWYPLMHIDIFYVIFFSWQPHLQFGSKHNIMNHQNT